MQPVSGPLALVATSVHVAARRDVGLPRRWGSGTVVGACVGLLVGCGSTAIPVAVPPVPQGPAAVGTTAAAPRTTTTDAPAPAELLPPQEGLSTGPAEARTAAVGGAPTQARADGPGALPVPREVRRDAVVEVGYALPAHDVAAFVTATGFAADPGDLEASARAVAAEVNRRGGVRGAALSLVLKSVPTEQAVRHPSPTAQSTCEYFTNDHPVDVVLSSVSAINTPTLFACLARKDVPVLLLDPNPHSLAAEFERFAGTVYHHATVATERLAPVWTDRLARQGWFEGWDTDRGTPASRPAVHGLLHQTGDGMFAQSLRQSLRRHRQVVAASVEYADFHDGARQMSVIVHQMKAKGVSHVFVDKPLTLALFARAALSQAYYPRYAITTNHGPSAFLTDNVHPQQLRGAAGVGFFPLADIPNPYRFSRYRDAPPARVCDALHEAAGVRATTQMALLYQHLHCDALRLLVDAFLAGAGTTAPHLRRGFALQRAPRAAAGPEHTWFGPRRYDGASSVRDLAYDGSQQRFVYGDGRTTVS